METKRKTLLEKYDIPLNHLDFEYIKTCSDVREIEKIVQILRSNEEGFYPDLTKCAEDKLRELKPNSKLFRVEESIQKRDALPKDELKPIYDWNQDIKSKDHSLVELGKAVEESKAEKLLLPPIRQTGKIDKLQAVTTKESTGTSSNTANTKKQERIKSTDYSKWDKYDADEEVLRLELAEERQVEENEIQKRIQKDKVEKTKKVIEMTAAEKDAEIAKQLTELERDKLAEDFRLRGNEYFRVKEYENALMEYTRAIRLNTKATAKLYNNRAITYLKMHKYLAAIENCEECLRIEPNNLKARLRIAEANLQYGRRREAYDLFQKVLEIDEQNAIALQAMDEIRKQLGDLPPPTATRMKIEEGSNADLTTKSSRKEKATVNKESHKEPPPKDYDLAELVKPNRLVKGNMTAAADSLKALNTQCMSPKQLQGIQTSPKACNNDCNSELILPMNTPKPLGKVLIEEI